MLKRLAAVSVCVLMAACGSSNSSTGNAAAGTNFTYGTTTAPVSGESSNAISNQMQNMISAAGDPNESNTQGLKSFSGISNSLLGTTEFTGYGKIVPNSANTARDLAFKLASKLMSASSQAIDPNCIHETDTSVTFTNCTDTDTSNPNMSLTLTINGSASVTGTYTLAWSFTVGVVGTGSGEAAGVSVNASYTTSGNITLTETTTTTGTIVGSELASLDITATAPTESFHVGVDQSLDLDVQYDTSCEYFVIGGTLEAKRVWTAVPQGMEDELKNIAVKVTWTGCGEGTYVESVN